MEKTKCSNKTLPLDMELVPPKIGWKEESQTSIGRRSGHLEARIRTHYGLPKNTSECGVLKHARAKAATKFPIAKIRESIDDWLRRLYHCVQAKEDHFEWFFCVSILYILADCIHRIYISHSVFLLLAFTFGTELIATLDILYEREWEIFLEISSLFFKNYPQFIFL